MALSKRKPKPLMPRELVWLMDDRWVHAREAVYLLGRVSIRPDMDEKAIAAAEKSAMRTLSLMAAQWGIVKVKASERDGAGCCYTLRSLLEYKERRELEAMRAFEKAREAQEGESPEDRRRRFSLA